MFQDKNASEFPRIEFPSNWKKELSMTSSDCQTEPLKSNENETQTALTEEVGIQTDTIERDGKLNIGILLLICF